MSSVATTKKKSGAQDSVKRAGSRVKLYVKNYKSDLEKAYDIGYRKGWDDAYTIPNRIGAKTAAARGHKKGLKNRKKSDKYVRQYNKGNG